MGLTTVILIGLFFVVLMGGVVVALISLHRYLRVKDEYFKGELTKIKHETEDIRNLFKNEVLTVLNEIRAFNKH